MTPFKGYLYHKKQAKILENIGITVKFTKYTVFFFSIKVFPPSFGKGAFLTKSILNKFLNEEETFNFMLTKYSPAQKIGLKLTKDALYRLELYNIENEVIIGIVIRGNHGKNEEFEFRGNKEALLFGYSHTYITVSLLESFEKDVKYLLKVTRIGKVSKEDKQIDSEKDVTCNCENAFKPKKEIKSEKPKYSENKIKDCNSGFCPTDKNKPTIVSKASSNTISEDNDKARSHRISENDDNAPSKYFKFDLLTGAIIVLILCAPLLMITIIFVCRKNS